ncbi:D-alanyl-D-alanine carboxypeptidase/D-alanyl-D-alanine-endopeptidase [Solitalea sp. MAHUQ-68]|uniref:D-alanyl-D-alanine carboxypeptidase/D-alanyl-D-alanine-endopeptidase n=1 Tax=Solitalea agri TaxID=2953739 RepID=A0A9X2JDT6_9SPHI|nr:D-alanyl-D-alanine carboxypeptidase/D-alanyl-D-alanine-endopeptidase [Solitalea agri]MCO4294802.1 D-alanyl-D-alanine carboxypeptidase/D-alanyl-D-alanine-endopeptidase [Solitalea agri]
MKKSLLLFLALICSTSGFSQTLKQRLTAGINSLQNDAQLKYASISLTVLNAKSAAEVFTLNANQGLATASTLKIITSTSALSLLGADYTYKTQFGYSGYIDNQGVLHGNLIIKGSGDPTLATWRYEQTKENLVLNNICNAVKYAGIKKVEGLLIADDSAFPSQSLPDGWIWQDIGNYYGTGSSALTWRENQFDINLKVGKSVGDSVKILSIKPSMPYLGLKNELTTGPKGTGDEAYVFLAPYTTTGYIRGEVGVDEQNITVSAAVPDPAFECASEIKNALAQENGLKVEITTARRLTLENKPIPVLTKSLIDIQSPPLKDIVYWFNKKSVNLYGEHLLKTIAKEKGKSATTNNGVELIREFWSKQGIDKNAINISDGSGLSPGNRVAGIAMARVLNYARAQSWFSAFYNSLPEANGLKMKDGFINGVRSYAGYVDSKDGNTYTFVFIINNFSGSPKEMRQKMWKVLDLMK